MKKYLKIISAGLLFGAVSVLLVYFGNPRNMGLCIACFLRDTAGALNLHKADAVRYVRPEIIGIVLGAFAMAFFKKEFSVRGGSSPITRFFLGAFVMVGALMFLGCPSRAVLRLAGGDLNAIFGLLGFASGIAVGVVFLNKGFSLGKTAPLSKAEGSVMPLFSVGLLAVLVIVPGILLFSESGPGSMHAPIAISLAAGLLIGAVAQRTRLCFVGGIRDAIMFKDFYMLWGFVGVFVAALLGNLLFGFLKLGFAEQPIAHMDGLWNFLGMALAGLGSAFLGGCPMRQLILAGSGNSDSAVTVFGLLFGAAIAHNFGLASSAAGPTDAGKLAVIICLAATVAVGLFNRRKAA